MARNRPFFARFACDRRGKTLSWKSRLVEGNTFLDTSSYSTAINVGPGGTAQIIDNVIRLSGAGTGVSVSATDNSVTSAIAGNRISTNGLGTGVSITLGQATMGDSVVNVVVQGNDFHGNQVGVEVASSVPFYPPHYTGPRDYSTHARTAGIDLGGGALGGLGGNDFGGFTAPATAASGAIVLMNVSPAQGVVAARMNVFAAGVAPETVTWDGNEAAALTDVDESAALTGNAAFVALAYGQILKRAGDVNNASDAGNWVGALNRGALTQAAVAAALARSPEALVGPVDGVYQQFLGRLPNVAEQAGAVANLEAGGSIEGLIGELATSSEYAALYPSDGAFIMSLYLKVLGRIPSGAEATGWIATLQTSNRAAVVNDFLASAEFRGSAVQQLYGCGSASAFSTALQFPLLLHRLTPPAPAETDLWVYLSADLLSIEACVASSPEFLVDG